MAGLQIPMKSSAASAASSGPKINNQNSALFSVVYPQQGYAGYVGIPTGFSTLGTFDTNVNQTIALNTNQETVGSSQINAYFQNVCADFQLTGGYPTLNQDFGANQEIVVGWGSIASNAVGSARTWSNAVRIASMERLAAGKSVGASFMFCPAFKIENISGPYNATLSNIQITAVLRLMNTAGTLTTIGTLTTNAKSAGVVSGTQYIYDQVYVSSFSPQTSNLGDRIIIDLTISASVSAGTAPASGVTRFAVGCSFGRPGTTRKIAADYEAHRPFQISIT